MRSSVKTWSNDEWLEKYRSRVMRSPIGSRCSRYCRSGLSDRCSCAVSADFYLVKPGRTVAREQSLESFQVHRFDEVVIEAGLP